MLLVERQSSRSPRCTANTLCAFAWLRMSFLKRRICSYLILAIAHIIGCTGVLVSPLVLRTSTTEMEDAHMVSIFIVANGTCTRTRIYLRPRAAIG